MPSGSAPASGENLDVVIAVRLMQLMAMYDDVELTTEADARRHKLTVADQLLVSTRGLPIDPPLPERFAPLGSSHPGPDLAAALEARAAKLAERLSERSSNEALIELAVTTDWPSKTEWAGDQDALLAHAGEPLDPETDRDDITAIRKAHRKAVKRLRADSTSPATQAGWGLFTVASTVAAPGLANGLGTFVGTQFLGYSGAAATSAGLALLGGGSLAAGGFGMAGGALLVHGLTTVAKAGGTSLITKLASQSPSAILSELAKLDVAVTLEPRRRNSVVLELKRLQHHLEEQLISLQEQSESWRWGDAADHAGQAIRKPKTMLTSFRSARNDLVPEDQRNLASSRRAVQYEIRHLESSDWKRVVSKGPRVLRMPIASRLLDNF